MKNTIFILTILFAAISCQKNNRKAVKYKIEVISTFGVNYVTHSSSDFGSSTFVPDNVNHYVKEWKGKKLNDISVTTYSDGGATIKIYKNKKVVAEKTGVNISIQYHSES